MASNRDLFTGAEQPKLGGINQVGVIAFQSVILALEKPSGAKQNVKITERIQKPIGPANGEYLLIWLPISSLKLKQCCGEPTCISLIQNPVSARKLIRQGFRESGLNERTLIVWR